ncbi:MlaA family lipoprotein [uncultured Sphingomonas sp.]|uniref:MlaA family lipoprotein n=1 Tax=uncultured Sphingomonas sp. TaxID=158754 RepID=UPI0025EA2C5B|nr:MlaA family lipoprotein [uncultured Sphingomonas sp.]
MTRSHFALVPLACLLTAGCATVPGQDRLAERDPLEGFNRTMWGVNQAADKVVIKPVTSVYRTVAPRPVRQGVSNFFANLTEPWSLVNNLLQGKPKRAVTNLRRFVINTTIGVAGLFDRASKMGVQPAPEDLGQTLAKWGVNGGPYLVLPLLGPSTLRDGVGSGVAAFGDPVNVAVNQADVNVWYKRGYRAGQIVSARSDLTDSGADAFLKSSLDPYAAARSAYLQRRRAQILDQEDGMDAGPADDFAPAAEAVPTPTGDASTAPNAATSAGQSAAPLPGDEPVPTDGAATPGAAPMPGDDGTVPAADAAGLPESSAPMPGDDVPPAQPPRP